MQDLYLKALGIMQWVERDYIAPALPVVLPDPPMKPLVIATPITTNSPPIDTTTQRVDASTTMDLSNPRLIVDQIMNHDQNALDKWVQLKNSIQHCQGCASAERRVHAVFGKGRAVTNLQTLPKILFVLSSPSREEDLQGDVLVGKNQLLFNQVLDALKIPKTSVFVTHATKCKSDIDTPNFDACSPYLHAQITLLNPEVIVLMGIDSVSVNALNTHLMHIHSPIHLIQTISLNSIEFNPLLKKSLWNDLKRIKTQKLE